MAFPIARRQQVATRVAFFIPGFIIASWAPLVPLAKARASMDDAVLGLVLLCLGLGSLVAMPLSGMLAARFGCRPVMIVAVAAMVLALPLLAMAGTPLTIGLVLAVFGAAIGGMDCVMNIQAVKVERESGRALMSGFHAFYSIGSLVGAAAVTALLSLGSGALLATMTASACAIAMAGLSMHAWRSDREPRGESSFAMPRGVVLVIGLICFVTFLVEGSMLDWSAVFLHEVRGIGLEHAGWGFVAFNMAMTGARLLGDRVVDRLGHSAAVLVGGLVAAAGLALATLHSSLAATLSGFALLGVGCANIVPVMFTYAGRQDTLPERIAIPVVTTMGYAGILLGPALIGFIAHHGSLSLAFLLASAALVCVAFVGAAIRLR